MNGQPKNERSIFRHRGFFCPVCSNVTMVFGLDPEPTVCQNCSQSAKPLIKEWDHTVTSTTQVTDYQG